MCSAIHHRNNQAGSVASAAPDVGPLTTMRPTRSASSQSLSLVPPVPSKVDLPVDRQDALAAETTELFLRQVRGRGPVRPQYPVPRGVVIGELGQDEPGEARRSRAGHGRHIAVRGDRTGGYPRHDVEHPLRQLHVHAASKYAAVRLCRIGRRDRADPVGSLRHRRRSAGCRGVARGCCRWAVMGSGHD